MHTIILVDIKLISFVVINADIIYQLVINQHLRCALKIMILVQIINHTNIIQTLDNVYQAAYPLNMY